MEISFLHIIGNNNEFIAADAEQFAWVKNIEDFGYCSYENFISLMMTVKIVDFFHPIDIDINDADGSIFPGFKMTERVHKGVPVQRVCQQIMVAETVQQLDVVSVPDSVREEDSHGKQQIRRIFDFFTVVIIDADIACQLVIQKNRRSDQRGDFLGVQRSISRRISLLQLFDIVDDDTVVFFKKRQPVGNQ